MNMTQSVFWLIAAVVLFVVETATYQMVCIWFAVGAVMATIVAGFGAPLWAQFAVFLVFSIVVLVIGRPLVKDKIRVRRAATNADRVIGQVGIVKEEINNDLQTGRVVANGLYWTARTEDADLVVAPGEKVRAVRIEGVKLIVEPLLAAVSTGRK